MNKDGPIAVNLKRTKIVCTIGPASSNPKVMQELVTAGMDCARLNFSHGTLQEHLEVIRMVRKASRRTGKLVAVMLDLPGPKLRVGALKGGSVALADGSMVTLTTDIIAGDARIIPVQSENLPKYVKVGSIVFLSEGQIRLRILSTTENEIRCRCEVGGRLLPGKGVNIPDLKHDFETFTRQDRKFLAFGLEHGVDLVAISFVRRASDIEAVRHFSADKGRVPALIAKIEKKEAVENISKIIDVSDAVMVARGDLGVENPIEEVPQLQKSIIAKCRSRGVPVITATQMLESMVTSPSPTRAEVTDVANAIFDGTDAVMLSEETAIGKYPVECVNVLNRVALKAEERMLEDETIMSFSDFRSEDPVDAFSESAWRLSQAVNASLIAVHAEGEAILPKISRFRPAAAIVYMTRDERKLRQSTIVWGVYQNVVNKPRDSRLDLTIRRFVREGYIKDGTVVFIREITHSLKQVGFSFFVVTDGKSDTTELQAVSKERRGSRG